jgi:hypothetical protein
MFAHPSPPLASEIYLSAPKATVCEDTFLLGSRSRRGGEVLRGVNRGRESRSIVRGHDASGVEQRSGFTQHKLVRMRVECEGTRKSDEEEEEARDAENDEIPKTPHGSDNKACRDRQVGIRFAIAFAPRRIVCTKVSEITNREKIRMQVLRKEHECTIFPPSPSPSSANDTVYWGFAGCPPPP